MKGELINTLDTGNSSSRPLSPCLWNKIHSSLIIQNTPSAGCPKNLSCWVHITPVVSVLGSEHRGQHWRHNERPGTRYMVMSAPASPRALTRCHIEGCRYRVSHNWVLTLFCLFSQLPMLIQRFILPFFNSPGDDDSKTHLTFLPISKIDQVTEQNVEQPWFRYNLDKPCMYQNNNI